MPIGIDRFLSLSQHPIDREKIIWLPMPGSWRYIADPFGMWRNNELFVFVEAYDYLTKKGAIHRYAFDASLRFLGSACCLEEKAHLSYPFVFEFEGETFMLPEQSRSGRLVLYRARQFPDQWVAECTILDDLPIVDPSLLHHGGRWWMFFSIAGPAYLDRRELHLAHAKSPLGPWTLHVSSPIIRSFTHGRPGGTPWENSDGHVIVPVQDCSQSYGGGINFIQITRLDPETVELMPTTESVRGELFSDEWKDGAHTLARCDAVTLFDVKKNYYSFGRYAIDLKRELRRLIGVT